MNDFNELNSLKSAKEKQDEFNKRFLIKFMIFMFYYRIYIMYIDPQGLLVNSIDEFFFQKDKEIDKELEILSLDKLD